MKSKARAAQPARPLLPSPLIRQAIVDTLPLRLTATAVILLPAVPELLEHYVDGLCTTWATLGRHFAPTQRDHLRQALDEKLHQAFAHSPSSRVRVSYDTDPAPGTSLTWKIGIEHATMVEQYDEWTKTRDEPLFGRHPDAKVMDVARSLGAPSAVHVLDCGAGTGRNALPLARAGFAVDALELAPALARILREEIATQGLSVRTIEGNLLDASLELPAQHYQLMFLSEVVSHFRSSEELRAMFARAEQLLCAGGILLFNAFLPLNGYKPDALARQISEVMWCRIFTRHELSAAVEGTSLTCVSDESTLEYERAHLPAEQWPPTGWYEDWCSGRNAFKLPAAKSPMAARWLAYQKPR